MSIERYELPDEWDFSSAPPHEWYYSGRDREGGYYRYCIAGGFNVNGNPKFELSVRWYKAQPPGKSISHSGVTVPECRFDTLKEAVEYAQQFDHSTR